MCPQASIASLNGGFLWGVNDEVDAASGARNDRCRDVDGDDGDAAAVRRKPHYFTALP